MSEVWGHYLTDIAGHPASIVFDDGIAADIDNAAQSHALRIKVRMKERHGNGLPTTAEGDRLSAIGEKIIRAINSGGGLYLGRVTVNGLRCMMTLIPENSQSLQERIQSIAEEAEYEIGLLESPDPEKQVYWNDLYPSEDERRVMNDLSVINALSNHGDNAEKERPVDHWAYFPDKSAVSAYSDWLISEGYEKVSLARSDEGPSSERKWRVRCIHTGTTLVNDITRHTLKLNRKAKELGGEYDGWETQVIREK